MDSRQRLFNKGTTRHRSIGLWKKTPNHNLSSVQRLRPVTTCKPNSENGSPNAEFVSPAFTLYVTQPSSQKISFDELVHFVIKRSCTWWLPPVTLPTFAMRSSTPRPFSPRLQMQVQSRATLPLRPTRILPDLQFMVNRNTSQGPTSEFEIPEGKSRQRCLYQLHEVNQANHLDMTLKRNNQNLSNSSVSPCLNYYNHYRLI
jgi:hypothetical protein